LAAQQTASPQSEPDATQQPVDSRQSAQSFEGKITKSGDTLVLQDASSQATYQLDDQDKAKQFKGQNVKVTATTDPYQSSPCGRHRSFGEQIACDTQQSNERPLRLSAAGFLLFPKVVAAV
jgi:hypothetical protein